MSMTADAGARTPSRKRAPAAAWPTFSIVIPTYQRREVVREAVRALGQLKYEGEVVVIVVIDGSTDGTAAALSKIALPFPMTIVEQPNRGAADARNRGAALAQSDVILFLDDDMIADADLLEQHGRLHREGVDAVIGDTPIHSSSPPGFLAESVARWITASRVRSPLSPFDIFSGQLSVRRAVFQELGGFDTVLTSGAAFGNEDAELGVRLLAKYDVRHNPAAISRQVYVVSPREFMDRAGLAAAADVRFIRKHPGLASELLERKGFSRPLTRLVYRPLARIPLIAGLLAGMAVRVADGALKTPAKSNRIIARFFSGARSLAYWSALQESGWLPSSGRLLVLCYHAIEDQSDDPVLAPYGVPPKRFVDQLDSLTRRGFSFISPDQLAAFVRSKAPLPRRPVLLTFDDGHAGLLDVARNQLRPRGIQALAFVVTNVPSGTNEWDQAYGASTLRLLTNEERKETESLGVEIGSHSRTHREMPLLTDRERRLEARGSSADLVSAGLRPPRFFAYPFGARNEDSRKAVAEAGFLAAFGLSYRRASQASDVFDLPRVMILSTDGNRRFWMKTAAPDIVRWYYHGRRGFRALFRRVSA
jgi:glycosyltransferase involved in cell wall biosynthesis/peptidoglycan/xylan/chitin deacetylase (PgdA/CDA1 family)